MQIAFGFGAEEDLIWVRAQLRRQLGNPGAPHLRTPVGQLIKSMISSRTRDEVSRAAFDRLVESYADWAALATAPADEIRETIEDVTFPEDKARNLRETLRIIGDDHPDFDLIFLSRMSVEQALDWLERLPGVGRKVAASTLNFSTLTMPSFVIDTHILRILRRFGFVRTTSDIAKAYETVMEMASGWSAAELAELHMLIKRLGQTVCRSAGGDRGNCALRQRCKAVATLPEDHRARAAVVFT